MPSDKNKYAKNSLSPSHGHTRLGKEQGTEPVEHANPARHGNRPQHPYAIVHPGPAAPRGTAAWRLADSRTPDTDFLGHGGFSNGDRRRAPGRSGFHAR